MLRAADDGPIEYCFDLLPQVCATYESRIQFWEVLISLTVAFVTIFASVWLAKRTATSAVELELKKMRTGRRARLVLHFADFCFDTARGVSGGENAPETVELLGTQMAVYSDDEEAGAVTWMLMAARDIQSEGVNVLERFLELPEEEHTKENVEAVRDRARHVVLEAYAKRRKYLEGWVRFSGPWEEFVAAKPSSEADPNGTAPGSSNKPES